MTNDKSKDGNKGAEAKAAKKAAEAKAAKAGPVLRIAASQNQRMRAGYLFGRQPIDILVSDLTEEQIDLIVNDPVLTVVEA